MPPTELALPYHFKGGVSPPALERNFRALVTWLNSFATLYDDDGTTLSQVGDILPVADVTHDLGSAAFTWAALYVDDIYDRAGAVAVDVQNRNLDGGDWYLTAGNSLGVGTATPAADLHVASGNVLVNTATQVIDAGNRLGLKGTVAEAAGNAYLVTENSTGAIIAYFGTDFSNLAGFGGTYTAHDYGLRSNNVNRLLVTATGHILIDPGDVGGKLGINRGTSDPSYHLHIGAGADTNRAFIAGAFVTNTLAANARLIFVDENFGLGGGNYGAGAGEDATVIWAYEGAGRGIALMSTTDGAATTFRSMTMRMFIDTGSGNVGIGPTAPVAQLHVDQSSATGAKPVLLLDQADIDEDYLKIIGTSDTFVDRALVDAADFTTPGSIVGWLKINVQDDQGTGPITDGDYYIPFYSAPSA